MIFAQVPGKDAEESYLMDDTPKEMVWDWIPKSQQSFELCEMYLGLSENVGLIFPMK